MCELAISEMTTLLLDQPTCESHMVIKAMLSEHETTLYKSFKANSESIVHFENAYAKNEFLEAKVKNPQAKLSRVSTSEENHQVLEETVNWESNKLDTLGDEFREFSKCNLAPGSTTDEICAIIRENIFNRRGGSVLDTIIQDHRKTIVISNITAK